MMSIIKAGTVLAIAALGALAGCAAPEPAEQSNFSFEVPPVTRVLAESMFQALDDDKVDETRSASEGPGAAGVDTDTDSEDAWDANVADPPAMPSVQIPSEVSLAASESSTSTGTRVGQGIVTQPVASVSGQNGVAESTRSLDSQRGLGSVGFPSGPVSGTSGFGADGLQVATQLVLKTIGRIDACSNTQNLADLYRYNLFPALQRVIEQTVLSKNIRYDSRYAAAWQCADRQLDTMACADFEVQPGASTLPRVVQMSEYCHRLAGTM